MFRTLPYHTCVPNCTLFLSFSLSLNLMSLYIVFLSLSYSRMSLPLCWLIPSLLCIYHYVEKSLARMSLWTLLLGWLRLVSLIHLFRMEPSYLQQQLCHLLSLSLQRAQYVVVVVFYSRRECSNVKVDVLLSYIIIYTPMMAELYTDRVVSFLITSRVEITAIGGEVTYYDHPKLKTAFEF